MHGTCDLARINLSSLCLWLVWYLAPPDPQQTWCSWLLYIDINTLIIIRIFFMGRVTAVVIGFGVNWLYLYASDGLLGKLADNWRRYLVWFESIVTHRRHMSSDIFYCPAMVQIMACRLFVAKPFPKQIVTYCQLGYYEKCQWNIN